jgi:predicted dienelactone hydrolase
VIFSHGLGGSRDAAPYLGKALARASFASVHIQHAGSDRALYHDDDRSLAIARKLRASLRDPQNAIDRFRDVPFVIDELARRNMSGPWAGRLDLARIGMAGHSYGAVSTVIAAGRRVGPNYDSFKEPRVRAGLMLSPNLPSGDLDLARVFAGIDRPLFHVTGTEDKSPITGRDGMDPARRTQPYALIRAPEQYLLVFDGADHMMFNGHRVGTAREKPGEAAQLAALAQGAVAFFRAHLMNDPKSRTWLRYEFPKMLAPGDRFEFK